MPDAGSPVEGVGLLLSREEDDTPVQVPTEYAHHIGKRRATRNGKTPPPLPLPSPGNAIPVPIDDPDRIPTNPGEYIRAPTIRPGEFIADNDVMRTMVQEELIDVVKKIALAVSGASGNGSGGSGGSQNGSSRGALGLTRGDWTKWFLGVVVFIIGAAVAVNTQFLGRATHEEVDKKIELQSRQYSAPAKAYVENHAKEFRVLERRIDLLEQSFLTFQSSVGEDIKEIKDMLKKRR